MDGMYSNGMCRCCASEGTFKDLSSKYRWMGVDEVYADMLRECFDVTLSSSDDSPEGGICEVCITQLRNAANFKKQVLSTEEQFKRMVQNKPFKSNIVKVEVNPPEDNMHLADEDNNLSNDDFSDPEYELPIKTESSEESKGRKRTRAGSSRKPKVESESSAKRIGRKVDVGIKFSKVLNLIKSAEVKTEPNNEWAVSIRKKPDKVQNSPTKKKAVKNEEINLHLQNLVEILLNTNATPIRNYDGLGYTCCFCFDASFPDLQDLKSHTLMNHNDSDKKMFMSNYPLSAFVVKLDITELQCIMCFKSAVTLEEMMAHLVEEHNRTLHLKVKNRMLPFRFEDGVFSCVLCPKKIEHFKVMQEHLNVHYGSFLCKICAAPFMSQRNLLCHVKRHKQGEFACKTCSKVFDTHTKRDDHERSVHGGNNRRSKCPICLEKFITHYKRQEHMVQEHGAEQMIYKCMACDRTFEQRNKLTKHRRRDHLMERSHECTECDKKFFSSKALKDHMVSHTGLREFQCEVCLKSYGRKHTLREHMRIHKDDRRFKCEHCDQAFVQKCSWKSHMRSKHGIVVTYS